MFERNRGTALPRTHQPSPADPRFSSDGTHLARDGHDLGGRKPLFARRAQPRTNTQAQAISAGALTIRSDRDGDDYVVALAGELDVAGVPRLESELHEAEASDAGRIVLDLGELEFVDSIGMRIILQTSARAREHDRALLIVPGGAGVQRAFELSGLATRLPFAAREP